MRYTAFPACRGALFALDTMSVTVEAMRNLAKRLHGEYECSFAQNLLDGKSADAFVISALVRVAVASLLAEEEPHFQQIGTVELPLWAEGKQSLGLTAA